MPDVGVEELLKAGVHLGHQTSRWNPQMRRFIYTEISGIHIIDLERSAQLLNEAKNFSADLAARGGVFLFVSTKKQANETVKRVAEAADMPYVNHRWLGGLLTNFETINKRIKRLHELNEDSEDGSLKLLPTKERMSSEAERGKLTVNLGGVMDMERRPDAVVIVDIGTEAIAVNEAARLGIPIIALVDSNCDPDKINYIVPGNDDAIRSCEIFLNTIGEAVAAGHAKFTHEAEAARKIAEEEARKAAEERAEREEANREKREAQEKEEAERLSKRAAEVEAQEAERAKEAEQAEKRQLEATAVAEAKAEEAAEPEAEDEPADDQKEDQKESEEQ